MGNKTSKSRKSAPRNVSGTKIKHQTPSNKRSENKAREIDLSVFETESSECNVTEKEGEIVSNCSYLQRMCAGLRYYDLLCKEGKAKQSKVMKELLVGFCDTTYTMMLDDYVHIVEHHKHHLIEIGDEMEAKCDDIRTCNKLERHYRGRGESENKDEFEEDGNFLFYRDCFDRCHHQIFHLQAMGLKIKREEIEMKEDENEVDGICVDSVFKQRRDLIMRRKKECGLDLERYKEENNKYNIQQQKGASVENGTCLDSMCQVIQNNEITQYLDLNQYDTEGVEEDLEDVMDHKNDIEDKQNEAVSNIWNCTKKKLCIQIMREHIARIKCMLYLCLLFIYLFQYNIYSVFRLIFDWLRVLLLAVF